MPKGEKLIGPKQKLSGANVVQKNSKEFENVKIEEINWPKSYSYTISYLQKNSKRLFQKICKNKLSGANVVQNVKIEESNHIYLEMFLVGLNSSNLCTSTKIAN
jgi:hypothetical protein